MRVLSPGKRPVELFAHIDGLRSYDLVAQVAVREQIREVVAGQDVRLAAAVVLLELRRLLEGLHVVLLQRQARASDRLVRELAGVLGVLELQVRDLHILLLRRGRLGADLGTHRVELALEVVLQLRVALPDHVRHVPLDLGADRVEAADRRSHRSLLPHRQVAAVEA